jgi:hypothetical protein
VADQMSEIPTEEYVVEKLSSAKEYQPKTERGKRSLSASLNKSSMLRDHKRKKGMCLGLELEC